MKLTCDIDETDLLDTISDSVAEKVYDQMDGDWVSTVLAPTLKPLVTPELVQETLQKTIDVVINQEWDRVVRCIEKAVDDIVHRKLTDTLKISL